MDGWTLPFRLSIEGQCSGPNNAHPTEIDCSQLSFEKCPTDELLGDKRYAAWHVVYMASPSQKGGERPSRSLSRLVFLFI